MINNRVLFERLDEFANTQDDELTEYIRYLLDAANLTQYMGDEFRKSYFTELKDLLNHMEEQYEIVEEEVTRKYTVKRLKERMYP